MSAENPGVVRARCYDFPLEGRLDLRTCALLVIDMQRDFLDPGGFYARTGGNVSALRAIIPTLRKVLEACRRAGLFVIHTRQGYRADLADLPRFKAIRNRMAGAPIGEPGPLGRLFVRGEPGWAHVAELQPLPAEPVIDKTANNAFCGTDLDAILRGHGIKRLILAGVTTEVCVHSTIRAADDLGYECLLIDDCCASGDPRAHEAALYMMSVEGGAFGCLASSSSLLTSLAFMETR